VAYSSLICRWEWLETEDAKRFSDAYRAPRERVSTADPEKIAKTEVDFFPFNLILHYLINQTYFKKGQGMKNIFSNRTIILILSIVVIVFISGCSKSAATTPDKVVDTVAQDLSKNQPQVLWNALPESYQKDVNELLSDFAAKMDKDIWNKTFELIQKIITILKTKKELILTGDMVNKAPFDKKQMSESWGSFVAILEIIVKSELADLDKIRKLSIEKFLAGTVSSLMKKASEVSKLEKENKYNKELDKLTRIKTSIIKTENEETTIKIEVPDKEPEVVVFIKVDNKWIPKDLAGQWKEKISEIKNELSEASEKITVEEKQKALGMMKSFDGILDQILAAKTKEDLEPIIGQGIGMLFGIFLSKG